MSGRLRFLRRPSGAVGVAILLFVAVVALRRWRQLKGHGIVEDQSSDGERAHREQTAANRILPARTT